jgi:hypothetical protein
MDFGPILFDRCGERLAISLPLFFAGYIVLQCPCSRLPACHKEMFFGLIAFSMALVIMQLQKKT